MAGAIDLDKSEREKLDEERREVLEQLQDWPVTPEGRILSFILAVYAFTIFGYVTATLAPFFIELDKGREDGRVNAETIEELRREVAALRDEIRPFSSLKKD